MRKRTMAASAMRLPMPDSVLCWHRPLPRKGKHVCVNCGVSIEPCPCDQWRQADANCPACMGSGWVSLVRGKIAKFKEYAGV